VCVDDAGALRALAAAAEAEGAVVNVLVEVNAGQDRRAQQFDVIDEITAAEFLRNFDFSLQKSYRTIASPPAPLGRPPRARGGCANAQRVTHGAARTPARAGSWRV
jgi:D-serine deaminase-like pyridoxal phosphate-dependent protein